VLQARGFSFRYVEVSGGHDPLNWQQSLPEGLLYLLARPSAS
jgi:enterochelin esterase-like enzyme